MEFVAVKSGYAGDICQRKLSSPLGDGLYDLFFLRRSQRAGTGEKIDAALAGKMQYERFGLGGERNDFFGAQRGFDFF